MYSCQSLSRTRYNYLFKISVVGQTGVGKSNMCLQFVEKRLRYLHEPTQTMEYAAKTLEIENQKIKLELWDTSTDYGMDPCRFDTQSNSISSAQSLQLTSHKKSSLPPRITNSAGVILVFSITNRETYKSTERWLTDFKNRFHEHTKFVLVGNKADLAQSRCVSTIEAQGLASRFGIEYKQISTKQYSDVYGVFRDMAQQIYEGVTTGKYPLNYNVNGARAAPAVSFFQMSDSIIMRKSNCC